MRLIDADTFASVLEFADSDVCEEFPDGYCEFGISREKIRELLRDAPTVDAVPVVRCSNCIHWVTDDLGNHVCSVFDIANSYGEPVATKPDDFCSYGKRKGETD